MDKMDKAKEFFALALADEIMGDLFISPLKMENYTYTQGRLAYMAEVLPDATILEWLMANRLFLFPAPPNNGQNLCSLIRDGQDFGPGIEKEEFALNERIFHTWFVSDGKISLGGEIFFDQERDITHMSDRIDEDNLPITAARVVDYFPTAVEAVWHDMIVKRMGGAGGWTRTRSFFNEHENSIALKARQRVCVGWEWEDDGRIKIKSFHDGHKQPDLGVKIIMHRSA